MENNHDILQQKIEEESEKTKEEWKQQPVECREEIRQTVTETNETIIQVREELKNKISNVEEEGKLRATEFYQVLTEGCQKNKQEVVKELEERHQELQIK